METTINYRLRIWLEYKKISQAEFGRNIGVTRAQVNNWCTVTAPIPDKTVLLIINLFSDLNSNWFLKGEGEMLNTSEPTTRHTSPYDHICNDPGCVAERKILYAQIEDLIDDKRRLKADNDHLRQKGEPSPGEKFKGGVEKRRNAG